MNHALEKMVKKLICDDFERCIDSYLVGRRVRTAVDLVQAAMYIDRATVKPYIEHGQLFITPEWRIRHECMTEKEKKILSQVRYVTKTHILCSVRKPIHHNFHLRMGPSMRLAFQCLYHRAKKTPAN